MLTLFKYETPPERGRGGFMSLDELITYRGLYGARNILNLHAWNRNRPSEMVARDAELEGDFSRANLVRLRAGRMIEDKGMTFMLPSLVSIYDDYRYQALFEITFGTVHLAAKHISGKGRIVGRFVWPVRNPLIIRPDPNTDFA